MKKSLILLLTITLTAAILLCSCGEAAGTEQTKVEPETRSDELPETQIETVAPQTEKPEAKTEAPAQTTEAPAQTTEAPAQTTAETAADTSAALIYDLSLEWYLGYVGSSTHSSFKNKLNKSGAAYSYSQIVRFPNAGTKISFVDDNTNSNGDTNFASAAAYVFSSWKENNGVWELDLSAYNASGTDASYKEKSGARTYTYTTKKANECLRFGYRSGQSTSFTPAKFPMIHVEGGAMPEKITETEVKIVLEGTATTVKWNGGYVGSDTNAYNYQYKLYPGAGGYAYTDVIEVAKAGTKLSFIDTHNGITTTNAFVVSAWTKVSGEWQIDKDGFNVSGSPSAVVSKNDNGTLYSYTTSKDGECIRFCYRSDGNEVTNPPVIYLVENAGKGTLQMMNEAAEDLSAYLKNDLTKLDNSSLFAGKTMYVIGDSYFAGNGLEPQYVWPSLLAKKYGMTFENYGVNGSAVSTYDTSKNPMVTRYTSMKSGSPDIVIIEGGKNDYNVSAPLGTADSTDIKTFRGALRTLIEGVQKKYPNAKIVCVTPWYVSGTNSLGLTVQDYGQAMISLCNSMEIPVINAQDRTASGVDMTSSTFRTKYCMTASDISHLNLDGMKLVLPFFEMQIAEKIK